MLCVVTDYHFSPYHFNFACYSYNHLQGLTETFNQPIPLWMVRTDMYVQLGLLTISKTQTIALK